MADPRKQPQDHDCFHEDDFLRFESLVSKVFNKMDTFIGELHTILVADAVRQQKMDQLDRDVNRAFGDIRTHDINISTLRDWQTKFDGSLRVVLAIPIICTLITTGVALYVLARG
jgi:hypothetical protein